MFRRTKKCSIAITPLGLIAIFPSGEKVRAEMMSSDYEHLIHTFDKHFGFYVTLEFDVHPSSKHA